MKKIVKFSEYPYGRITKRLKNASQWINSHRRCIKKNGFNDFFDYPEYWGMPRNISSTLSPDEVDFLQGQTYDWAMKYVWNKTEVTKEDKS